MRLDILRALNAERAARRGAIVVTNAESGAQRLVKAADVAADPLREILAARLRSGKSGPADSPEGRVFLSVHVPPTKLVITGAVHISQALAPIARILGYDGTIVARYTAFVALTHDPKIDDPALLHALARDCFYIGALGSKKTHGRRVERLKAQGVNGEALGRIHAPIGLPLGAVSPSEIAIAIMGEITARLRLGAEKAS